MSSAISAGTSSSKASSNSSRRSDGPNQVPKVVGSAVNRGIQAKGQQIPSKEQGIEQRALATAVRAHKHMELIQLHVHIPASSGS